MLVNLIAVNQTDPYDSDSSDGGSEFPSQSTIPEPPFQRSQIPNYETYKCPEISTECERVISSAKKLITPERNHLGEDIIEACEYLKVWWRNSLIEQQFGHFKK
jgi:hypothetical protein